jgi:hypothetical protein
MQTKLNKSLRVMVGSFFPSWMSSRKIPKRRRLPHYIASAGVLRNPSYHCSCQVTITRVPRHKSLQNAAACAQEAHRQHHIPTARCYTVRFSQLYVRLRLCVFNQSVTGIPESARRRVTLTMIPEVAKWSIPYRSANAVCAGTGTRAVCHSPSPCLNAAKLWW